MGYYIQGPTVAKACFLVGNHEAKIVSQPNSFAEVPVGKALVCVVENGFFDAAGYVYNEQGFKDFSLPDDHRAKTWLLMDKALVEKLTEFGAL